jgi:hypothetical protein
MEATFVNLLWSGGWDSSFRLLQLLVVQERHVQPYYLFDTRRKSLANELDAMYKIRKGIESTFPAAAGRLSNTFFANKDEFDASEEVRAYYKQFSDQYKIGTQYLWLAAFSKAKKIRGLELSIEKDDYTNSWLEQLIPYMVDDGDGYTVRTTGDPGDKLRLFSDFRFPLLDLDKGAMEIIAQKHGFINILRHSWFCHNPVLNMPCGICRPCKLSLKGGHRHQYTMPHIAFRSVLQMLRYMKAKSMAVYQPKRVGI